MSKYLMIKKKRKYCFYKLQLDSYSLADYKNITNSYKVNISSAFNFPIIVKLTTLIDL